MGTSFLATAFGFSALMSVYATASNKPWETLWKRVFLNPDISASNEKLAKVLDLPDDLRKEVIQGKNWWAKYKPLNFSDRTEPLCRLFFDRPRTSSDGTLSNSHFLYCSCSFVSPTIVLTAAHCVSSNETLSEILRSKYLIYVVQQYGLMGNDYAAHKEHTTKNARLVTEAWFPEAYQEKCSPDRFDESPMDIAFLKIDPTRPATSHYEIMLTTVESTLTAKGYTVLGKEMIAIGFPKQFKQGEEAATYAGTLTDKTKWEVDGKKKLLPFQLAIRGKLFQNWGIAAGAIASVVGTKVFQER